MKAHKSALEHGISEEDSIYAAKHHVYIGDLDDGSPARRAGIVRRCHGGQARAQAARSALHRIGRCAWVANAIQTITVASDSAAALRDLKLLDPD